MNKYKLDVYYATRNSPSHKNQDNMIIDKFLTCCSGLTRFSGYIELYTDEKRLFAVSDGAGGEASPDRASDITVHTFSSYIDYIKCSDSQKALYKAADAANEDVVRFFEQMGHGGAATVSGILFEKDKVWIFNAGDSPIYRIKGRTIERLSKEHTLTAEKSGGINYKKNTRASNIITRYMGNSTITGSSQLYLCSYPLEAGETFVLTSDGVEKGLSDSNIRSLLAKKTLNEAQTLVDKAYKKGSHDDITAVVIRVSIR